MKVIVLGAGVIGVTTAYFLARDGHEVIVIEKNPSAAQGCSYANGGQLSYSHIETWAQSNSTLSSLKTILKAQSFLSFCELSNKKFWSWMWQFYKNSKQDKARSNSEKLLQLANFSKVTLSKILSQESDIKFDYKNNGILHFYRDKKKFDAAAREAQFYGELGHRAKILTAEDCVKKEPTLVKLLDEKKLAGGIFYENDASGNCAAFVSCLEKICREKYGVVFEYNTEVRNLFTNYKKITGIHTNKSVFTADKYVCALGATGSKLLCGIGIEDSVYPLKGYSLSIDTNEEFVAPSMALTDPENRIVYSRQGKIFRAAGTLELCGLKAAKNKKNIELLKNTIRGTFSDFGNINEVEEWSGFRPFRPNSLPLICEVKKYGNLLINSGHGSLGWTLSAASGKILSDIVAGNKDQKFSFLEEEEKKIYDN